MVGRASEIPPGARKIVYPQPGPGIGVFNVDGRFYALKNTCPHMGAPLCEFGLLTGTTTARSTPDGRLEFEWIRENEILKCPWHSWEFDLTTGRTVFPSRNRVASYEVSLDEQPDPALERSVETYPVVLRDAVVYIDLGKKQAASS